MTTDRIITWTSLVSMSLKPESFKLLYLGGALNWEWRFLRIHAENNPQLQLSAIIKSDPKLIFAAASVRNRWKT